MYHYIEDKAFLGDMKCLCAGIINQLDQRINNDSVMSVKAFLVGSGAKNLNTQNADEAIDLDYNLQIIDSAMRDGREIKAYIQKQFNVILNRNGWSDCQDSTSVLTTELRHFTRGNQTEFRIDLAIVKQDENGWHRLIHEKTGFAALDRFYWNLAPSSRDLSERVSAIKQENLWNEVREMYLDLKNMYLCRRDQNHPSFLVYIEAINQVYYRHFGNKIPQCIPCVPMAFGVDNLILGSYNDSVDVRQRIGIQKGW